MNVREYIAENWDKTIRTKGSLSGSLDLPYRYTSPCAKGLFDDFYYWDTYFINQALVLEGKEDIALNNLRDFAYLIQKYGFVPNSANEGMLNRSQVPLFILACHDYLTRFPSEDILKELYPSMVKEYGFWMENRCSESGLNHYGNHATKEFREFFCGEYQTRVHLLPEGTKEEIGNNALGECESGWDFSNRFLQHSTDYAPVDLNSILYANECILSQYAKQLHSEDPYGKAAERRKETMDSLMRKDGIYYDYDVRHQKIHEFRTCASFLPYFVGLSKDKVSFDLLLSSLLFPYGLSATEEIKTPINYQWQFPNMWPNLVFFAFKAAKNIQDEAAMKEIGERYLSTVDSEFEKSHCLWEKYDVLIKGKARQHEYQETEMMGWTAGTYVVIDEELNHGKR